MVCHCAACHKTSGSTYSTAIFIQDAQFKVLSGTVKTFTAKHEYGMDLTLHFCGDCSTMMWKTGTAEQFRGKLSLNLGTLDDLSLMDKLKPEKEFYAPKRTAWVPEVQGAVQSQDY